jgi:hypothetical protein
VIVLTCPDGSKISVDGTRVVRARRSVAGESANTRLDWVVTSYVMEPIDEVAGLIQAEQGQSFTCLTSRDGSKIWFNGRNAIGPIALPPGQLDGVVKSSIRVMNQVIRVCEDEGQVRQVIASAGGEPLP